MCKSEFNLAKKVYASLFTISIVLIGTSRANANWQDEEKTAVTYFQSGRYNEAAALFKNVVGHSGCWARDYYYLALCLMQLKQPALATEYIWKAYVRNSDTDQDPQISNQCVQALVNSAYCKTLKLKGNVPQQFRFFDRHGKLLTEGQLSYGSKGLSGKMDSTIDVKFGRWSLPGLSDKSAKGGFFGDDKGFRYVYQGGNVDVIVNRKEFAKELTDEEFAKYDAEAEALKEQAKPKMQVCLSRSLNKDGTADVYLVIYPNK